jgi:hypothetical protein
MYVGIKVGGVKFLISFHFGTVKRKKKNYAGSESHSPH